MVAQVMSKLLRIRPQLQESSFPGCYLCYTHCFSCHFSFNWGGEGPLSLTLATNYLKLAETYSFYLLIDAYEILFKNGRPILEPMSRTSGTILSTILL